MPGNHGDHVHEQADRKEDFRLVPGCRRDQQQRRHSDGGHRARVRHDEPFQPAANRIVVGPGSGVGDPGGKAHQQHGGARESPGAGRRALLGRVQPKQAGGAAHDETDREEMEDRRRLDIQADLAGKQEARVDAGNLRRPGLRRKQNMFAGHGWPAQITPVPRLLDREARLARKWM